MVPVRNIQLILFTAATAFMLAPGALEARSISSATRTGKSFAKMKQEADIRRFAEICPGLARGGDPGEEGLRYLRGQGYRTIVSFLPSASESATVVQSGMRYVHIPMRSGLFFADPPTDGQVRQFLSVVKDTTLYPIFIHCHAGKDRTGAMSAIYRMEVCGWTPGEAQEEMLAFGFSGRYRKLQQFVQGYAATRPAGSSSSPATMAAVDAKQNSPAPVSNAASTPMAEANK